MVGVIDLVVFEVYCLDYSDGELEEDEGDVEPEVDDLWEFDVEEGDDEEVDVDEGGEGGADKDVGDGSEVLLEGGGGAVGGRGYVVVYVLVEGGCVAEGGEVDGLDEEGEDED